MGEEFRISNCSHLWHDIGLHIGGRVLDMQLEAPSSLLSLRNFLFRIRSLNFSGVKRHSYLSLYVQPRIHNSNSLGFLGMNAAWISQAEKGHGFSTSQLWRQTNTELWSLFLDKDLTCYILLGSRFWRTSTINKYFQWSHKDANRVTAMHCSKQH